MHDSNIYIKDKPIIIVSGSFCGVYANIIGFVLMEERDIQLYSFLYLFWNYFYVLKIKC